MTYRFLLGVALLAGILLVLSGSDTRGSGSTRAMVSVYLTTPDAKLLMSKESLSSSFAKTSGLGVPLVTVDDRKRFQTIDGFGGALTGSSAYLISRLPDHGAALLAELFREDVGIGLSYVRVSIGASDFSLGSYTYDDTAPGLPDTQLRSFSVTRDADVFAVLSAIHGISADARFMASPWSAPAWMKSSGSLNGGELRARFYPVYARYLVSYLQELRSRGLTLDALTPQNEPLLNSGAYPSMTMSAAQEARFVKSALGPALRTAFPATKLLIGDHNWAQEYPSAILRDRGAAPYVAGAAFHCYAGDVAQMSAVSAIDPSKGVYISECSGGAWAPVFRDNLSWDVRNLIVGGTENGARAVLLGNLALDDAAGPTNGGCMNCRGIVTIHADGSITRNVEYYVLAQVAKFVRPGSVRIASTRPLGDALPNVAFMNPDGTEVLIAFNAASRRIALAVRFDRAEFRYSIPAGAVATFVST